MKSPSSSAENGAEWESYVGKAILRFGDIEIVSIRLISASSPGKSLNAISRISFSDRAEQLISLFESQQTLTDSEDGLLNGLRRARELAQKRNLIAHNPLMLDIYVNNDESEVFVEHSIASVRSDGEFLDLATLKEFAGEVENLAAEMWGDYCRVVGSSNDLWRIHDAETLRQ